MRIINGKKFYKADLDRAKQIDGNGWDYYNGQNYQWYTLSYDKQSGVVILSASNSGDCYGDYSTRYFESPLAFARKYPKGRSIGGYPSRSWEELLGDIDEKDENVIDFINKVLPTKADVLQRGENK